MVRLILSAAFALGAAAGVAQADPLPPNLIPTIEKWVCKELANKQSDGELVDMVCGAMAIDMVPKALCEDVAAKVLAKAEEKCPPALVAYGLEKVLGMPPIVQNIEKFVCEKLKNNVTDEVIEKLICHEVLKKVPRLPEALCEKAAEKFIAKVESKCPPAALKGVNPIVEKIEKFVCQQLAKNATDDEIAQMACGTLCQKFKQLPEPFCEEIAKKALANVAEKCPPALISEPIIPLIKKLMCKALANNETDEVVEKTICEAVEKQVPRFPAEICEKLAEKLVNGAKKECPPAKTMVKDLPKIVQTIEKLVCKELASNKTDEEIAHGACEELTELLPFLGLLPEEFCEKVAYKALTNVEEKCPPAFVAALPPIVQKIEEVVCKALAEGAVDTEIAKVVCEKIHDEVPRLPEGLCEAAAAQVIKKVAAKCPKPAADIIV